jgi:putative spermidine/putrescine transport system ATP-binding protein
VSAAVELVELGRVHGDVVALAGVDLTVPAGSCVAVLGPSGSGKSTLLRLLAGLDVPSTGVVRLDGVDQSGVAAERRGAALVSQRPLLFPHLSVLDNVAFAARVGGASRRAARAGAGEYLDLVQLGGLGRRRTGQLSGGQAQRVALARALAARPRVLLLDEPFSALDSVLRADMHALLATVRAELAPTVVLVTHDQDEAALLADTVAVLTDGHLLQHGPPAQVYTRPASMAVHRVMGGRTAVPGTVRTGVHHSDLGALAVAGAPDGAGLLVLRHESVRLGGDVAGTVAAVTPRGPRRLLEVHVGTAAVFVEVPPGPGPSVGDEVALTVPVEARWVVPPGSPDPDVVDGRPRT